MGEWDYLDNLPSEHSERGYEGPGPCPDGRMVMITGDDGIPHAIDLGADDRQLPDPDVVVGQVISNVADVHVGFFDRLFHH